MPRSRSVLAADERADFGEWLDRVRRRRGLAKKALARALGRPGGATNRQINAYLSGTTPASEATLSTLAVALDVPERYLLLKGGYFEPLLRDIEDLVALGQWYCGLDGFSFRDCVEGRPVPATARHLEPIGSAPYVRIAVKDVRATARVYTVPSPAFAAVHTALLAFPLRGERYRGVDQARAFPSFDSRGHRRRPGKMARELTEAAKRLQERSLPSESRRAVAGEYVRAWINKQCGAFAHDVAWMVHGPPSWVADISDIPIDLAVVGLGENGVNQ